jgi:hypothetical protein
MKRSILIFASGVGLGLAGQNASSIQMTGKAGEEAVAIRNVGYEVAGRLVLRKTEQTRRVMGEKGTEASTVLEAWPLGSDLKVKPAYSLKVAGIDGRVMNDQLFIVTRGLEDVAWWSVYRLADGKPLFDTHLPILPFEDRYAGLDVPADGDPRLKDGRLIGIVNIATAERVIRRVELRCDDVHRARLLRSYWDVNRTLTYSADRKELAVTIRDAAPALIIQVPLEGAEVIRCCDIVTR